MALEIDGRIKQKLARQNGQSAKGAWTKQDFILEYQDGSYPAEVCVTAFGNDRVADLDKYQVGDSVKVAFNLKAREYNGRWYNDVRLWRITPEGQTAQTQQAGRQSSEGFAPAARSDYGTRPRQAPAPTIDDLPGDDPENDLPF